MRHDADRKARILVVDDHPIVRQGMSMLINGEPELQACCEADNIEQAMATCHSYAHDLAIVDMSLAGESGLELIKKLRLQCPAMRLLMLSMHDEAIYAEPALQAGAHGYLMKQAATSTMLQAIRLILDGGLYVSERMHLRMLNRLRGDSTETAPLNCLTSSEFEILHLIGMGLSTGEISRKLNRSVKTIEAHRANIKRKLDLKNASKLTQFAFNLLSS